MKLSFEELEEESEEKGEEFAEIIYRKGWDSLEELIETLESLGMEGVDIEVEKEGDEVREIVVRVDETVTSDFYEENPDVEVEDPACRFEAALFRKLAELYYDVEMEVEEERCRLSGDDHCEFRIRPRS
ncbi:V4R domain-containing protein [Methanopyrus sp.]